MKAIIVTGGKQYYVEEGKEIFVEKLNVEPGQTVTIEDVLMLDGTVGTPKVKGASVEAEVVKQGKQKKILVYKYRPKKKYRRTQGHRQPYTKLKITKINKK